MATPNAPSRPGRALAFLALVLAALYATMALTGTWRPKLALDLEGGTTVQLKAVPVPGKNGEVNSQNMQNAMEIIRDRVNGAGVSEAEVTVQGADTILVSVPASLSQDTIRKIGQTALLYFRPVLAQGPGGVAQPASPQPSASPGAASPRPSATRQGRAVSRALLAAPNASPTGRPPQPASAPPIPPQAQYEGQVPPELMRQWNTIDCTDQEQRKPKTPTDPTKPVVLCSQDGTVKYALGPAIVEGTHLTGAEAGIPQQGAGAWQVNLTFDGEGTKKFAEATKKLRDQPSPQNEFAIVLDDQVVSAPYVQEAIPGGQAQITGNFTQKEAQDLANVLKYGALPLQFTTQEVNTVSPTLGGDQLKGGLIAMILGLALTVLYSLLYYRGLGVVAMVSLAVAAALTYAVVVLLGPAMGFALSLAGIAGLVIAIGITADSFIVFFERIRDEIREGRTLRVAIEYGWTRARRTILVADFVSFLAAAVLYLMATGGVKGFAFTLGLTTLVDVAVVFLFTKPLVTLLARYKFFAQGHPLSGLDPKRLGAKQRPAPTPGRRRPAAKPAAKEA
ncbi:protein translocase subunit SecD [Carbonactinospora thermoautotrophica]|uniref:protein translocase subunit SecD n=1 Tax=Carbonactinospora thermoautotrophica TaxID=1469144 RepID=UPI0027E16270|nr:protein translocase subunit SecD [Carbonactinospora thermoautotrophica]